jgi:hypothetical protein
MKALAYQLQQVVLELFLELVLKGLWYQSWSQMAAVTEKENVTVGRLKIGACERRSFWG